MSFSEEFSARLKTLEQRAKAAGSNITQVCKRSGVSRATFERWVFRPPQTVVKLDELEAEVERLEREAAARVVS